MAMVIQVQSYLPVIMNDSPKKVARHSHSVINCGKNKGYLAYQMFQTFLTQPEEGQLWHWFLIVLGERERKLLIRK